MMLNVVTIALTCRLIMTIPYVKIHLTNPMLNGIAAKKGIWEDVVWAS